MPPRALLAIRTDIAPSIESEYLDWMTREHTIERIGIDGFVSARIFRAKRTDIRRYMILYELENAAVLDDPAYLERLNNPTPWTARMMPNLGNFIRSGGQVVRSLGAGCGGVAIPVPVQSGAPAPERGQLEELSRTSGVVAVRLLETDADRTRVKTNESSKRAGDRTFDALLLIEGSGEAALVGALDKHPALLDAARREDGEQCVYSLVFSLTKSPGMVASPKASRRLV